MKKALLILGFVGVGGAGFGAGYFFGNRNKKEAVEKAFDHGFDFGKGYIPGTVVPESDDYELETIRTFENGPIKDATNAIQQMGEAFEEVLSEYRGGEPDDDPEMPMDEPKIPDDPLTEDPEEDEETDIPQHHPENLLPHPISEEEYDANQNGYDLMDMVYYAENDGVYDPEYDELMPNPEQLLGYGWFTLFSPTTDVIYIENDTMGTIYRIRYDHGSLEDSRGG